MLLLKTHFFYIMKYINSFIIVVILLIKYIPYNNMKKWVFIINKIREKYTFIKKYNSAIMLLTKYTKVLR